MKASFLRPGAVFALAIMIAPIWGCAQSTDDLWDVRQGTVVTAHSPYNGGNQIVMDARDAFGGDYQRFPPNYPYERYNVIFADNGADYVYFLEWHTPAPVTVGSFRLFARGDGFGGGNPHNTDREFAQFRLYAKSSDSATYDQILYLFTPTNPYTFADPLTATLVDATIPPVTAQYFRAEFIGRAGAFSGPRIIELDAFNPDPITALTALGPGTVRFTSVAGWAYTLEASGDLQAWAGTATANGSGGTLRLTDPQVTAFAVRFYRVRAEKR